jgi:Ca-activated chloride channel homolog
MNINPEDPKWTAYVLGELSAAEKAQVEQELESSAAARELVDEIRIAASLLRHELVRECAPALSTEQKRTISAAAAPQRRRPVLRWLAVPASVAAGVVIAIAVWDTSYKSLRLPEVAVAPPAAPAGSTAIPQIGLERDAQPKPAADDAGRRKLEPPEETTELIARQIAPPEQGQEAQQVRETTAYALSDEMKRQATVTALNSVAGVAGGAAFAPSVMLPAAPAAAAADRIDRARLNTEAYNVISDNPFIRVAQEPQATFSIDVDTASYSNVRRFLNMKQRPPRDSVRIEEMINYFSYDYPQPTGRHPIAAYTEVAATPWKPDHRLLRIGIKAKEVDLSKRPPSNLVFLVDVSSSMATPEKLPLLKNAMKLLVENLGEGDHVAIVTYAGTSGIQLRSTPGDRKEIINAAIDNLNWGGSTNGASGITLAYETAISNFIRGGTNRVILATDGDFNVGVTSQGELIRLIEDKAKSGVFLSVLGFGMGNLKDSTLEQLADKGDGNYAYIDTLSEARKVLVDEMAGTLLTVVKDVKIQIEFNVTEVTAYRLIGYENRALRPEDFNNDAKDAGDMGAGHTVTALFEVIPSGVAFESASVDPLKYQQPARPTSNAPRGEILNLKIRYKEPAGGASQLIESAVVDRGTAFNSASADFRFAAAVASFGMILRDSPHKGQSTIDAVIDMAERSKGLDRNGYRDEFVRLARMARNLR